MSSSTSAFGIISINLLDFSFINPSKVKNHTLYRNLLFHWVTTYTAAVAAESRQSCLTLCDPRDGSPPASFVPGILRARTLEWVAISFSNAWKWKVKVKLLSRVRLSVTPWTAAYQAPPSMGFSRQEYWPLRAVKNIPDAIIMMAISHHVFVKTHRMYTSNLGWIWPNIGSSLVGNVSFWWVMLTIEKVIHIEWQGW